MLRIKMIFLLAILSQVIYPQNKTALTFDDLPLSGPDVNVERVEQLNQKIVFILNEFNAPATGFVNESKLYKKDEVDERINILRLWLDAGLELGNHTFSHPSFNHTKLEKFIEDAVKGETVTKLLLSEADKELKYFRHPYLRTGSSIEDKTKFEKWLEERNCKVAPVTFENSDYIYNKIYTYALSNRDSALMTEIGEMYVDYTLRIINYLESVSDSLFGRQVNHTFLLHVNEINADYLDEILELLIEKNYQFVSLDEALNDEVYLLPDTYTGKAGPNWLFRWDYTNFGKKINWREEPVPSDYIMKLYNTSN